MSRLCSDGGGGEGRRRRGRERRAPAAIDSVRDMCGRAPPSATALLSQQRWKRKGATSSSDCLCRHALSHSTDAKIAASRARELSAAATSRTRPSLSPTPPERTCVGRGGLERLGTLPLLLLPLPPAPLPPAGPLPAPLPTPLPLPGTQRSKATTRPPLFTTCTVSSCARLVDSSGPQTKRIFRPSNRGRATEPAAGGVEAAVRSARGLCGLLGTDRLVEPTAAVTVAAADRARSRDEAVSARGSVGTAEAFAARGGEDERARVTAWPATALTDEAAAALEAPASPAEDSGDEEGDGAGDRCNSSPALSGCTDAPLLLSAASSRCCCSFVADASI